MHARFDRMDKKLLGRALSLLGEVRSEHEVAADAQRADTSFQPAPGCESRRAQMGLLGSMTLGPCLFEVFHGSFGLHGFDDCIRKQLTLGHVTGLEAKKAGQKRPPKPRLWIFAAGRPVSVLRGYALTPAHGFPAGFYAGAVAAAVGVVVLPELPRDRSTLFFRLFGKGEMRVQAVEELMALPPDAWEREVAIDPLVALRVEIPENGRDEEERRFLMATQDLFEEWKQRLVQQGRQEGVQQGRKEGVQQGREEGRKESRAEALVTVYEARFGSVPDELRAVLQRVGEEEDAPRWLVVVSTRPEQEVTEALLSAGRPRPARRRPSLRSGGAKPRR